MARYKIYDNSSDVITPVGEVLTAEQWLDEAVERCRRAGCDFSGCTTDEDYLAAMEAFEDAPPADTGISDQTRIADALEDMVALSLPDAE